MSARRYVRRVNFSTYLPMRSVSMFTGFTRLTLVQHCELEGVGNYPNPEALLLHRGDGETDAIHGNRSFENDMTH